MSLKVVDLFCGTGGFSHGFMQTNQFEVMLGIDIKPASVKTFAANHHNVSILKVKPHPNNGSFMKLSLLSGDRIIAQYPRLP